MFDKQTPSIVSFPPHNLTFVNFSEVGQKNAEEQRYFDDFYEEVFSELERKYGEVEEMNVCENIGEHMVGNVYVKFAKEEDADKCSKDVNDRWYVSAYS